MVFTPFWHNLCARSLFSKFKFKNPNFVEFETGVDFNGFQPLLAQPARSQSIFKIQTFKLCIKPHFDVHAFNKKKAKGHKAHPP